jgi:hypothetical protein
MKRSTFFVVCLLALLVAGPSLAQTRAPGYADKRLGVSFTPPRGWQKKDPGNVFEGLKALFTEPTPEDFRASINLVAVPDPSKRLPDDSPQQLQAVHKDQFQNYQQVGSARIKIGGKDAVSIAATYTMNGISVKMRQVVVLHGGLGFTFTLTAAEDEFPAKAKAFEQMMATVRWSPPKK